ncbi:MAG: bacteriohemerythrin [Lachnospiraceae bacterium]|nr:bacteriohemerythrin [Lachnospiraceae bacterium]MDE6981213.1 bacteriohemerythrin [Lachnospiraceae bacterium]
MTFQFTDDCIIGIEQIDVEHQYLFTIMNQIVDTLENNEGIPDESQKLETYIARLKEYGQIHFSHEEAYMEEHQDLELERQKREHKYFMARLNAIDLMDLNHEEKRKILEDMLQYLTKWLYQHILGSDTLIGKVRHLASESVHGCYCEFAPKYATGISHIDEEHKGLFEIINNAYRLVEENTFGDKYDEIMTVIDQLEEYTKVHFSHEEEYMESTSYPHLEAQRRAHDIFLSKLEDKDFGENERDQQAYLEDLLDFLFAWLSNHILKMDKGII